MPAIPLDTINRRLLMLLQQDNRRSLRDLASELGVSAPTCLRRMRRLESLGIIRAHSARLDVARLGFTVTAFVEVTLVNASGTEMNAFERRIQSCADVKDCAELTGEIDYMLTVVVQDLGEFTDFTRKHLVENPGVKSFRSFMILRQTKNEYVLPLESNN